MFDVVTATLVLHELRPPEREAVGKEMARMLTDSGQLLVIDYSPGPFRGLKG
jgi:ubiquinone/menaquinone biosynthesis C-methylase UbiE